jgi:hypothetical protein
MGENSIWGVGDVILLRCVWRNKLWFAMPVRLVLDTPELIALYWRCGTPKKMPAERLTPWQLVSDERIELVDRVWDQTDILMLSPPGSAYSIEVMWEAGQAQFRCWYVNLQDPLLRTPLGFDTMDQILDLVVSPDLSSWHWKDESEFAESVEHGVYSSEEARDIRQVGEGVIRSMREPDSLFYQGWEHWRPPPDWEIPGFPPDWDDLSFYEE